MSEPLRILLTNDDGVDAEGIWSLWEAFSGVDDVEVYMVAPDRERSTCSHGMSLARPVFVKQLGERRFSVDGLPVDCVYVAAYGLLPRIPHIVVSGINHGANLGSDVIFSGTVAAARQAALQGLHGIASSLVAGDDFQEAARVTAEIVLAMAEMPAAPPLVLNLNFPGSRFKGPRFAPLGRRHYPRVTSERQAPLTGQHYFWLGGPAVEDGDVSGTDGWLIRKGIASATLLSFNQTDEAQMARVSESGHELSAVIAPLSKDNK
jgi:5'-nucleotidase